MALVVRVIGGTLGGRRLLAVAGTETRPTTDRVREALFSRLESRYGLSGARVLDLFAGTGALGVEALSRGAARVLAAETSAAAAAVVERNCQALGLQDALQVSRGTAARLLCRLASGEERFDGAFLDPPYDGGLLPDTLASLVDSGVMRPGAWVVVESAKGQSVKAPNGLGVVREDRYGDSLLTLLEIDHEAGSKAAPKATPKADSKADRKIDSTTDSKTDSKVHGAEGAPE